MRARRIFFLLGTVALLAGAIAGVVRRDELLLRWYVRKLERAMPDRRRVVARELASTNPGVRALESIAFSFDPADPGSDAAQLREHALDALWTREVELGRGPLTPARSSHWELGPDRMVRYLLEGLGLERSRPLAHSRNSMRFRVVVDAIVLVMFQDPHEAMSDEAAVLIEDEPGAIATLARAVTECRHARTRLRAGRAVARRARSEHLALFERALADPERDVREVAALALVDEARETGVPVLIRALAPGKSKYAFDAVQRLADRRERRAVAALIALHESVDPSRQEPIDRALERITGVERPQSWSRWWEAHAREFPAQLDAESSP